MFQDKLQFSCKIITNMNVILDRLFRLKTKGCRRYAHLEGIQGNTIGSKSVYQTPLDKVHRIGDVQLRRRGINIQSIKSTIKS